MIPKPPSHCIMLLQNKIPCGCSSILFKSVEPVVVKPDIASKKPSVTVLTVPLRRNGSMPNKAKKIQVKVTMIKESFTSKLSISRFPLFPDLRPAEIKMKPDMAVMIVETVNAKISEIFDDNYNLSAIKLLTLYALSKFNMKQARLDEALGGVVEDCVNSVGVDVNTASHSLLSYIAGINATAAKNIVKYREENGEFKTRAQITKVPRIGAKAYEQCAGFLRIPGGKEILDNTGVHPESYAAAKALLSMFDYTEDDLKAGNLSFLKSKVIKKGIKQTADELGLGEPTLMDIIAELEKPGRDIRDGFDAPVLREDVLSLADLKPDMILTGTVRNVTDFGAFVDIGVHQDGLVHISQLSDKFIKHPSQAVSLGDVVKVKVMSVDVQKKRISLTMKFKE